MVKNHLSRLDAPVSWPMKRKGIKFVTRPSAGPHTLRESIPLSLILTHILKYARTRKEVKKILNEGKIFVNGIVRKDLTFPVGLMDVVSVPSLQENYRVFYDTFGKFKLFPTTPEEKAIKLVQIVNKRIISGGKVQINNSDGSNLLLGGKADYHTGDTLLLSIPGTKVIEHLSLKNGARIYITGGTKRGSVGTLKETKGHNIIVQGNEEVFETAKRYAFVIGKLSGFDTK